MKTIYFHIGLPKTGTSFLQTAFALNAKNYEKYDLIYLDTSYNFKEAIKGMTTSGNGLSIASYFNNVLSKKVLRINFSKLIAELDISKNYLFSSEHFSLSENFFKEISFFLDGKFNYKYIAGIRNPVDRLKSCYLQSLKSEGTEIIEEFAGNWIKNEKKNLKRLLNYKDPLFLFNYDFHKGNLLSIFDKLIFGKQISTQPDIKIVNPSPNNHQANILRLANNLNLNDFQKSMEYIEQNQHTLNQNKFKISKSLCDTVYNDLSLEFNEINKLLPENEKISFTYDDCVETSLQQLFTTNDIYFLRQLIDLRSPALSNSFVIATDENFEENKYVQANLDVKEHILNRLLKSGYEHFINYGKKEKRLQYK